MPNDIRTVQQFEEILAAPHYSVILFTTHDDETWKRDGEELLNAMADAYDHVEFYIMDISMSLAGLGREYNVGQHTIPTYIIFNPENGGVFSRLSRPNRLVLGLEIEKIPIDD